MVEILALSIGFWGMIQRSMVFIIRYCFVVHLFDKFGMKSTTLIQPKEYVAAKYVENEIQNVESGGTGVIKE